MDRKLLLPRSSDQGLVLGLVEPEIRWRLESDAGLVPRSQSSSVHERRAKIHGFRGGC